MKGKGGLGVRYAFSRGKCPDPKKCKREHRKLTDDEKLKRDKWEQAWVASGKTLPYERTEAHAAAAAKSVETAPGGGKGKNTKGKARASSRSAGASWNRGTHARAARIAGTGQIPQGIRDPTGRRETAMPSPPAWRGSCQVSPVRFPWQLNLFKGMGPPLMQRRLQSVPGHDHRLYLRNFWLVPSQSTQ